MPDAELLAFVRRGGSFKGGKKGKKGKKGAGKTWEPPPLNPQDIVCINCGGRGHAWRACTKPQLAVEDRPCLNCGKPGHISRNCPQPQKQQARLLDGGGEMRQQQEELTIVSTNMPEFVQLKVFLNMCAADYLIMMQSGAGRSTRTRPFSRKIPSTCIGRSRRSR